MYMCFQFPVLKAGHVDHLLFVCFLATETHRIFSKTLKPNIYKLLCIIHAVCAGRVASVPGLPQNA